MSSEFEPPIREVIVFQPETFPLYRWDNSSPSVSPRRKIKHDLPSTTTSAATAPASDLLPKLPFRRGTNSGNNRMANNKFHASSTSMTSTTSDDTSPRCPGRSRSPPPRTTTTSRGRNKNNHDENCPPFLASQALGPCRRPPSRTHSYNHNLDQNHSGMDLHQIPLKPITFNGKKVEAGIAQVLQEVVMDRCHRSTPENDHNCVNVLFAIRRPGCGQCREHGMQLGRMVQDKPHVTLTGVIKETAGIHSSIRDFYANYFTFPLYLDEGWDLYHTIGNKKLSLFKLCAKSPSMELRYAKKGIRNIPLGGDLFTQGGILIFDKDGKLRFVYYETYGKPLDMDAINWAIEQADKPMMTEACQ